MATVKICTSCNQLKNIRRRNGKCDSCYMKEDYKTRPGVKAKMNVTSAAWKRANKEKVRQYNMRYYQEKGKCQQQ